MKIQHFAAKNQPFTLYLRIFMGLFQHCSLTRPELSLAMAGSFFLGGQPEKGLGSIPPIWCK